MSTRAIIAVSGNDKVTGDWKGSYFHWDNYPERILPMLNKLVKRDGYDKATKTLVYDNPSWSVLNPEITEETFEQFETIKGYGRVYNDSDKTDEHSWYTNATEWYSWADYAYIMTTRGVEVNKVVRISQSTEQLETIAFYTWEEISAWDMAGVVL